MQVLSALGGHLDIPGGVAPPEALPLLLKEDGDLLAQEAVQIVLLHLLSHLGGPAAACLLLSVGHLAGHLGRGGAGAAGVGEDVHGGEAALLDEVQGLEKLLLRLPGEAYNEIGGNSGAVIDFPE